MVGREFAGEGNVLNDLVESRTGEMERQLPVVLSLSLLSLLWFVLFQDMAKNRDCCVGSVLYRRIAWLGSRREYYYNFYNLSLMFFLCEKYKVSR